MANFQKTETILNSYVTRVTKLSYWHDALNLVVVHRAKLFHFLLVFFLSDKKKSQQEYIKKKKEFIMLIN